MSASTVSAITSGLARGVSSCGRKCALEETPRSRSLVVIQIPPIGRDKVKSSIVKAINARKLEGLMPDVRDETDTEKGTRIVLDLRKDADAGEVLFQLFKETDLQVATLLPDGLLIWQSHASRSSTKTSGPARTAQLLERAPSRCIDTPL